MGQQQLLLIILGVIVVGIAIAVGLSLFSAQSIQANRDAIINDINNIAANAYQYYIRPISMAGGGGVYDNYTIPAKLSSNDNATYAATVVTGAGGTVTIVGTSSSTPNASTVTGVVDATGKVTFTATSFTGDFL
jgi:hypothetical protein